MPDPVIRQEGAIWGLAFCNQWLGKCLLIHPFHQQSVGIHTCLAIIHIARSAIVLAKP